MIKEVCIENFTQVPLMIDNGANRIELNNDLNAGGTTPSYGVIKKVVEYSHLRGIPIIVMIRPRSGNFVYSGDELKIMINDIQICGLLNVDGVAFGCLNKDSTLDKSSMLQLINLAHSLKLQIVMHMAFDEIEEVEQKNAIDWLIQQKVTRILTHGGSLSKPIDECINHIRKLIQYSKRKIQILPGGGITAKNVDIITSMLKAKQAHGTKILMIKR